MQLDAAAVVRQAEQLVPSLRAQVRRARESQGREGAIERTREEKREGESEEERD